MRESMKEVLFLLQSRCNCIWINTYEEAEVIKDLKELMQTNFRNAKLRVWSNTEGLKNVPITPAEKEEPANLKLREIPALFQNIHEVVDEGEQESNRDLTSVFYVLRDIHNLMQDARTRRCIRDIKEYKSARYVPFIVIAPSSEIHDEVAKLFRLVDYGLPTKEMIEEYVSVANSRIEKNIQKGKEGYVALDKKDFPEVAKACLGLTTKEINRILTQSLKKYKTLNIPYIMADKIEAVKKSGLLNFKQPKIKLDDVGGCTNLKEWFKEIILQMDDRATEFGLEKPKGTVFLGVPGAGKTMMAEAMAGEMNVPLLSFEMANVMDRLVGNSEKKIVAALDIAKSAAPCVLLLDEVEKLLGGINSSNNTDSGITARIFQSILKFLQDNDNGVYVVMTSNDVSQLPPEFTRTGRLDTQWFFDFPNKEGRKAILSLYFSQFNSIKVSDAILGHAVEKTKNFTGAELKEVVKNIARKSYVSFIKDNKKEAKVTVSDVDSAISEVVTVYNSSREKIEALRNWVKNRARYVDELENNPASDNTVDEMFDPLD